MEIITDPKLDNSPIEYVGVPKKVADIIDYLAKIGEKTSPHGIVETDNDWKILLEVYKGWKYLYYYEYLDFIQTAQMYKQMNRESGGANTEGGAFVIHRLEVPETLHKMIVTLFPRHKYTKEFVSRFTTELPELTINEKK